MFQRKLKNDPVVIPLKLYTITLFDFIIMESCLLVELNIQKVTEGLKKKFGKQRYVPIKNFTQFDETEVKKMKILNLLQLK